MHVAQKSLLYVNLEMYSHSDYYGKLKMQMQNTTAIFVYSFIN